MLNFLFIRNL